MSDKPIDFDEMSDEDFLKLSEEDAMKAVESQTPPESSEEENEDESTELVEETGTSDPADVSDESDESESDSDTGAETSEEKEDISAEGTAPDTGNDASSESQEKPGDKPGKDSKEKEKTPSGGEQESTDGDLTPEQTATAVAWFKQLTAPFKADGKDFQVRSVEDAIRLMQQGVNYSRRMEELKPVKRLNRMLEDHKLNTPEQLNYLIDLSRGSKEAIQKLLKDHNIDPMDLDSNTETPYQAPSYSGNPVLNDFREELDSAVSIPEGQALVTHISRDWDDASKKFLRENPGTLGNLLEMKRNGIYDQVVEELEYQRATGYLQQVPFLQAFDQVGEAMKNAGVLGNKPQPQEGQMGTLRASASNTAPATNPAPVAQGARKAAPPKREKPNPHLSSTPPTKQTNSGQFPAEPDFDKMSDEEFMKLSPPD